MKEELDEFMEEIAENIDEPLYTFDEKDRMVQIDKTKLQVWKKLKRRNT